MEPDAAGGEAVLAARDLRGELGDLDAVQVRAAGGAHGVASSVVGEVSCVGTAVPTSGSHTWNVVPSGPVSKFRLPLWRSSMIRRTVSRPRPVPRPTPLVVKNGSRTRRRTSFR